MKLAARRLEGRRQFRGLDISVETAKGSKRHWHDPHSGESGSTTMLYDYGYIRRTEGTDGDHVDVYVGPDENAENVFVIDQMKKPGFTEFDEQKCMLGFASAEDAKAAYLKHYNNPKFFGSMKAMPFEEFKMKVLDKSNRGEKIAEFSDVADRIDDAGIGILAAPYVADIAGKNLRRLGGVLPGRLGDVTMMAGGALQGGLGPDSPFAHSSLREATGLALVAPGITHTLAKRLAPAQNTERAVTEDAKIAGVESSIGRFFGGMARNSGSLRQAVHAMPGELARFGGAVKNAPLQAATGLANRIEHAATPSVNQVHAGFLSAKHNVPESMVQQGLNLQAARLPQARAATMAPSTPAVAPATPAPARISPAATPAAPVQTATTSAPAKGTSIVRATTAAPVAPGQGAAPRPLLSARNIAGAGVVGTGALGLYAAKKGIDTVAGLAEHRAEPLPYFETPGPGRPF